MDLMDAEQIERLDQMILGAIASLQGNDPHNSVREQPIVLLLCPLRGSELDRQHLREVYWWWDTLRAAKPALIIARLNHLVAIGAVERIQERGMWDNPEPEYLVVEPLDRLARIV